MTVSPTTVSRCLAQALSLGVTVAACATPSTTSNPNTQAEQQTSVPRTAAPSSVAEVPGEGPLHNRTFSRIDVPAGFLPVTGQELDKQAALAGNSIPEAQSLLDSGFRAGREMRWSDGTDTIYQLVIEFDNSAEAASYVDLSDNHSNARPATGLSPSKTFEGTSSGAHWVTVVFAQGPFIAVTQYTSHGDVDPTEASQKLALREAELLKT